MTPTPAGFEQIDIRSGFAAEFGAILVKREGDRVWLGFRVDASHLDGGVCHGGALATFADMQLAAWMRTGAFPVLQCPTVSLSLDFLAPARVGDWVEGEVSLVENSRRRVFTQTVLRVGTAGIVRANALYAMGSAPEPKPPTALAPPAPDPPPPDGFAKLDLGAGFGERFGPVHARAGVARLGFRVALRHVNVWGACHGGAIATFAHAQREALRWAGLTPGGLAQAIRHTVDYLAPARLGDWVEAEVALVKATRRFLFTQALITRDGEPIARSTAILAPPDVSDS